MALFKPVKGTSESIANLPIQSGQLIIAEDTKALYIDVSNSKRIRIDTEYQIVDELPTVDIDTNKIYLVPIERDKNNIKGGD